MARFGIVKDNEAWPKSTWRCRDLLRIVYNKEELDKKDVLNFTQAKLQELPETFPLGALWVPTEEVSLQYRAGLAIGKAIASRPKNTAFCERHPERTVAADLGKLFLHKLYGEKAAPAGSGVFKRKSAAWIKAALLKARTTSVKTLSHLARSKL